MNTKQFMTLLLSSTLLATALSVFVSKLLLSDNEISNSTEIADRLINIENKLAQEREIRIELQNSLAAIDRVSAVNIELENSPITSDREIENDGSAEFIESITASEQQEAIIPNPPVSQADIRKMALINTGLTEDEAAHILRSESDLTLEQLHRRYQSQRQRFEQRMNQSDTTQAQVNPLRAKLGDDYYEKYLQANGYPTSAHVNAVIESSPGFNAGLESGDQITSYAGQRVFNLNDVSNLTYQGTPGESVLIEIIRDGESIQLTIPRGPIGVTSGRYRFRR